MTEHQEERLVCALENLDYEMESIADALTSIAKTMELTHFKTYPPERQPRDLHVTRRPTEEDELRVDQGETGERTMQEWMTLNEEETMGPRQRRWVEEEKRRHEAERSSPAGFNRAGRGPTETGE